MDALILVPLILFFLYVVVELHDEWNSKDVGNHGKEDRYSTYLKDSRWKRKRERILERDGHKCTWCGREDHLEVHHLCYYKYPNGKFADPWDYPDEKLITLCRDCHEKYHKKYHVGTYYRKYGQHWE